MLQDIVEEVLGQDMWVTHARRLRRRELVEARPIIHLAVTATLSHARSAGALLGL